MEAKERHPLAERLERDGWPTCDTCEKVIPLERLEAVPHTTTCVKHSREAGYVGVMNYAHKTAGEVAMVKSDNKEAVRQLWRGYHRGR
jgi:hypothetical protein